MLLNQAWTDVFAQRWAEARRAGRAGQRGGEVVRVAPGGVLLLDKPWDVHDARLDGDEKNLIFLQAWVAVDKGRACWLDRWRAVTFGAGPEGTDDRFLGGRLQGARIGRRGKTVKQDTQA